MNRKPNGPPPSPPFKLMPDDPLDAVRDALQTMRYGAIALTVHDSRIVQMEVTEKRRF